MVASLIRDKKKCSRVHRPGQRLSWTGQVFPILHTLYCEQGWRPKGGAVTLYEETHCKKKLSNSKVEKKFLATLKTLLPEKCCPIIITDAGFRNPWFKEVKRLRWDFIGRIRGTHHYYDGKQWDACVNLYSKATFMPKCIQKVDLCKKSRLSLNLFLYQEKSKGRKSKKKYRRNQGGQCYKTYSRSAKEPGLLASSLSGKDALKIKRVIKYYKLRMQIEENFRDLKSTKFGFSLKNAYSRHINRIKILLMIAMLASFIAWLVGCFAEEKGWRSHYQVNSTKKRTLSLFYLGCRVIQRHAIPIDHFMQDMLQCAWNGIP